MLKGASAPHCPLAEHLYSRNPPESSGPLSWVQRALPYSLACHRASHTASATRFVVALPPRSGVCSEGSAVTCSTAFISRSAAGLLAQMLQHHRGGPEGSDWVGDTLAGDVEGRAMDGLEHLGRIALRVDVSGRRDAERARQRRRQVGQDVRMQ